MRFSHPHRWHPRAGAVKPLSRMVWDRPDVRQFTRDDVPDEDVQTILTMAIQAPSGFNLQPWRFVVVRSQEQRDRLRRAAHDQASVSEAPVVVVACGHREAGKEHAAEFSGPPDGPQDSAAFDFLRQQRVAAWLNRHVMVAFTYLMVAAEALGWDTAPMERFDASAVGAILGLPDDVEVVALLAIGRQRDPDHDVPGRLRLEQLVFAECWGRAWSDPHEVRV